MSFKTLVMQGKSGQFFVFALPIDKEVDMKKAAKVVGEKSLSMVHVKDINKVTGYIRGGCTPIGMKKQYPTVIHESANHCKWWKAWSTDFPGTGRSGKGNKRTICGYYQ